MPPASKNYLTYLIHRKIKERVCIQIYESKVGFT